MANTSDPKPDLLTPCAVTNKHFKTIKETLLKVAEDGDPIKFCENTAFITALEEKIFQGNPPSTGEIPAAIAEEYVHINNYHLKLEERASIQILLCGSSETWDAYTYLSNYLSVKLVQECTDLPKFISEISKANITAGKEFKTIAEKIKKAYDQACTVQLAYNAMKQCMEKACNADEKKKMDDKGLDQQLDEIGKAVRKLVRQAAQAHMSVVQAASIFALNDVAGLEALIAALKPQAEQFKKDTDGAIDSSAKKTAEWQKKYSEVIAAEAVAIGEYGKAANAKRGKEATYCFMDKTPEDMNWQKRHLLAIFDPKTKTPGSQTGSGLSQTSQSSKKGE